MVRRALRGWALPFAALVVIIAIQVMAIVPPASWWFEARSLYIADARAGRPVPAILDRSINRQFLGAWQLLVRRWGDGGWTVTCTANGKANYRVDAALPADLDLAWLSNGKCSTLPAGRYQVAIVWTIYAAIGERRVSVESLPFEVRE